ncbi:P-loop NTPase, partial [Streptococcus suis]|uniref:P-loop NTPase n=1 Tax=Streptococcus suis TaxID=1307 RepID=UPI00370B75ED
VMQPFTAEQLQRAVQKGAVKKTGGGDHGPKLQKIVGVMGARGGVGTSTIATNLAAVIARTHQVPTALVDLDFYFG